jgi:hypothetical protein
VANGYYRALGITATQKVKKIVPHPSTLKRRGVELRAMDKENKGSSLTQELLKYTKMQKISKDTTLYGVEVDYKVSKKVKVSLDILAKLNIKKPSRLIEEEQANLKIALSI